jgi:hypothetical protein
MVRLYRLLTGKGNDGSASTGASRRSSAAIASANPPVKHIPTAPTPGPPQRACSLAARARSQLITGEVLPVASTVNSRLMQVGTSDDST